MNQDNQSFWSLSATEMLTRLEATASGLTTDEAQKRLMRYGANRLKPPKRSDALTLLIAQFKSPIILILLFATGLSLFLHDPVDASIILTIVIISGLLGFWQEHSASNAVEKLLAMVQIKAAVLRDGNQQEIPVEDIVPGDIVVLNAGDIVPGDCLLLESKDVFVDEAMLTGETFPVEKAVSVLPADTALAQRTNTVWMGTHIVSGDAKALVIGTGKETEFGKVSERLKLKPPETEFEHGIRRFGYFLGEVTLVLVVIIFAVNVYLHRPVLDSFLFSMALAVGLTPQLLPAIISINLAHGAKKMAQKKVIVKRLASIENFGSMNVICSDKTGTLTLGSVRVESALDVNGASSDKVFLFAYLNACYETGFTNPIDEAIRAYRTLDLSEYRKKDEIPYDFFRKRLSIAVTHGDAHFMVTKGALANILDVCSLAETKEGTIIEIASVRDQIQKHFEELSNQGFRTLGIAYKNMPSESLINKSDETGMTFLGFLTLFDPPKPHIAETIAALKKLGVSLKIITGDNRLVAANLSRKMGLANTAIITGPDLHTMSDGALLSCVGQVDIFAEIEPNQKERIIIAIRKAGNVVGYMGDGINDASALHAADVGISVDTAADVAKDAADIVLLEKDLGVLVEGVREGRMTFANTLKYVFMATSANFGNMFSMAGVSLLIPFLPLLPKQVLLTNLMTDFPEMTIATDRVDDEMVDHPRRWDIKAIRKFMITFGLVSSVFDYLTFGLLLLVLHATEGQFRTAWFLESVVSASLIVLVIRSRKPFFRSRPGKFLLIATLSIVAITLIVPFTPLGNVFGFSPLGFSTYLLLLLIVAVYIIAAEIAKRIFYKKVKF
ncbi:MAG: magnesium-translocating P-type ATPase [Spirochaetes bacterium RBG_16_49_21]|nr:MAG: magnesium-translocating P-type ATPase [Spirochaetes bacterium RBG_16_49_21]